MTVNEPLLSFEFVTSKGNIPYTFKKPIKVIVATTIEEVFPCLELIQQAVSDGYFAAGYLSYESAPAFDSSFTVKSGNTMPLLWFGIFSESHHQTLSGSETYTLTRWKPNVSISEYQETIDSIKQAIESGDTYQTNYTIRFTSEFDGDDLTFFEKLKHSQASNYCAYINTGSHSILSASPELFFHKEGEQIITRPMKGTVKRGRSFDEDEANAKWLYHSEKNRAENLMIVDLLRNDLNTISEPGSVRVPKLFEIERYPTVLQMTSTIEAKVSKDRTLFEIFRGLFPCGSITGAPKISTMKFIAEFETSPREVYCGAIGFITPENEALFNVPIRTVWIEHSTGKATYGVGGGITWDSTSKEEYNEILAKAKVLEENRPKFHILESLLLEEGQYFLLEEHISRLKQTSHYFCFPFDHIEIEDLLSQFAHEHTEGLYKVRLLLAKTGDIIVEGSPAEPLMAPVKMVLADQPIDRNNPFLYHKTTNRTIYEGYQFTKQPEAFDVLLWNEAGEITEFTNGNVVVEIDGYYWTPPVTSGLLAGTYRASQIKQGKIHEKVLTIKDIKRSKKVWFINSVRKWVEVEFI
ncbi:aminodeoxychorismate synthase component I [Bacillus sp. HNG]|uniref:aminodeoxychorismate synthase component I n=1 Tax=Bacillus sp. HNG TaxID=2293325 RepID=UPI000E2F9347|nr:aminodeoxychorismate synthase component I [Bacillus sp. HNG]RFB13433.1 aminodeoxychorismate synthase component I [Bacillus sp. HNG]